MKKILLIFLVACLGCNSSKSNFPSITIYTSMGDIEAELYPDKAPQTVASFISYINKGFFNNAAFYRVVLLEGATPALNTGVVQGGVWQNPTAQNVPGIPHESTDASKLTHTDGTLSLARTTPGTASTEFFICVGDQTQYDFGNNGVGDKQGYSAFGKITRGMDIVRKIHSLPANGDQLLEKITIYKITLQ
ncbi:MAG: hypothetical protein RL172_1046 [Bacteroidota bacterium]|jgi:peptidyl-prolyl cis-trans isomerase A (cyclophilin A)